MRQSRWRRSGLGVALIDGAFDREGAVLGELLAKSARRCAVQPVLQRADRVFLRPWFGDLFCAAPRMQQNRPPDGGTPVAPPKTGRLWAGCCQPSAPTHGPRRPASPGDLGQRIAYGAVPMSVISVSTKQLAVSFSADTRVAFAQAVDPLGRRSH